ncbi:MAG: asparagine synthase (glutamine-hydrolyzing) [Candidatus Acidiferrales bacterium]
MCGIAGFIDKRPVVRQRLLEIASQMAASLIHRGPDDGGVWAEESANVAFGFRRLSIIDLSPAGHQPMHSSCGRYTIVFNGEVYNHAELRKLLSTSGHRFRGSSDTEVILAAISEWGVQSAVSRFTGMFSIALWDARERQLYLVRDRLGIKPLYYGWSGSVFLFASELKAFHAHPDFRAEVNRACVSLLHRFGYIPEPYAIYEGVHKLTPGYILQLSAREENFGTQQLHCYWSAREISKNAESQLVIERAEDDLVPELQSLLMDAVKTRMIADVPLGAFLSGGIDSSLVVSLMQASSSRPVKTFTVGFEEDAFNEANYARDVASHLGTDHTELYVTSREAQAVVPKLPEMFDEPFSDSSQIPTYLVSELARRFVTVSLSGDGGDELFGGYPRYILGDQAWSRFGRLPSSMKKGMSRALRVLNTDQWDLLYQSVEPLVPKKNRVSFMGRKAHKLAKMLAAEQPEIFYCLLVSQWQDPGEIVPDVTELKTTFDLFQNGDSPASFRERIMLLDLVTYLPGDILTKVDRASMSVGLEARVPLLDHRVVEFALCLPEKFKIKQGQGKFILRRILDRHVPRNLVERPKMGFGVPIAQWLRGPLRDWAETLLSEREMRQEGFLNPKPVRALWAAHLTGRFDWSDRLWTVLSFQAWHAKWKHGFRAPPPVVESALASQA